MNTYSLSIRIKLLLIVVILLCTVTAFAADPPDFGADPDFGVNDEEDEAPIDGLIGFAMAAGAIYGVQVLKKRNIQAHQ